ncbi:hypothetical protein HER10_EVM0002055 [Colletotrichum scovillei]|uniref:uncharacterized protein n=1 Tax=Colletotrichum scovillei TaxID=1209932 RepID=UPI0015C3AFED|nr:uncharacterized protein HER10_EVM0002055 [Colletotrichum scovillei]KAF4772700.1 hypothetical protein HER10_EVM0002055 [Colletotrichum scovillei]
MDGNSNHRAALFASASASPGVEETQTSKVTSMPPAARVIYGDFMEKLESLKTAVSRKGDEDDLDDALKLAKALGQVTASLMSTIKQEVSAVFSEEGSDTVADLDWLQAQRS